MFGSRHAQAGTSSICRFGLMLLVATVVCASAAPGSTSVLPRSGDQSGRIAFASSRSGPGLDIFTVLPDGSHLRRLTFGRAEDEQPAWSPDGAFIVFSSDRWPSFQGDIYVMRANGTHVRRLTHDPDPDIQPTWSPDGTRIAFVRAIHGFDRVFVIHTDGTGLRRLTGPHKAIANGSFPSWSPNGRAIAFEATGPGKNVDVYVMSPQGTHVRRLTTDRFADADPAWSPSGEAIAFDRGFPGNVDVFVMHSDGSHVRRLTRNPAPDFDPSWSPDGDRIVFTSERRGPEDVFIMRADGSHQVDLTKNPAADTMPDW